MLSFKFYYKMILKRDEIFKKIPDCFLDTNTIFTHIPKAAGISITSAIYGKEVGHIPLSLYKKILGAKFSNFYKFSFVRDPIDRFESAFYFLKNGGLNKFDYFYSVQVVGKYSNINDFILNYINEENIFEYIHFFPQYYFLVEKDTLLCDFVGKVENIDKDIQKLENQLQKKIKIRNNNKTIKKGDLVISQQAKKKLKRIYEKDYVLFDY